MKRKEALYGILLSIGGLVIGLIYGSQYGLPFHKAGLNSKAYIEPSYLCTQYDSPHGDWYCRNGTICPDNGYGSPDMRRCKAAPVGSKTIEIKTGQE